MPGNIKPVTMKQIIALFAVCGFALAFAACGQKSETSAEATDSSATSTEEVIESEPEMTTDSAALDSTALDSAAVQ